MHHPILIILSVFCMAIAPALVTLRPRRACDFDFDFDFVEDQRRTTSTAARV